MTENQHTHLSSILSDFSKMYHPNFDFLLKGDRWGFKDQPHEASVMLHEILKDNHVLQLYKRSDIRSLIGKFAAFITQEITLYFSREELAIISRLSEVHARLGLNQFDMLMRSNNHDDNALLSEYLTDKTGITTDDLNVSWDIYQVARHQLSWDAAGNPSKRDFSKMMGVNYDEPLKRGSEPLINISSN